MAKITSQIVSAWHADFGANPQLPVLDVGSNGSPKTYKHHGNCAG